MFINFVTRCFQYCHFCAKVDVCECDFLSRFVCLCVCYICVLTTRFFFFSLIIFRKNSFQGFIRLSYPFYGFFSASSLTFLNFELLHNRILLLIKWFFDIDHLSPNDCHFCLFVANSIITYRYSNVFFFISNWNS